MRPLTSLETCHWTKETNYRMRQHWAKFADSNKNIYLRLLYEIIKGGYFGGSVPIMYIKKKSQKSGKEEKERLRKMNDALLHTFEFKSTIPTRKREIGHLKNLWSNNELLTCLTVV